MNKTNKFEGVLKCIDFWNRYKQLSSRFQTMSKNNELTTSQIMSVFEEIGYSMKFEKKENFFSLMEINDNYKFQFNISLKYRNVELIWAIWENKILIKSISGPWNVIYKHALATEERIPMPKYCNEIDLKKILEEAFSIYEDFKKEMVKKEIDDPIT